MIYSRKNRILAHMRLGVARLGQHSRMMFGTAVASLFTVATAIAVVPPPEGAPKFQVDQVVEELAPNVRVVNLSGPNLFLREERIQRSDTLGTLLSRLGISESAAIEFLRQSRDTQIISQQLRADKVVTARTTEFGELDYLFFPLNDKDVALVVQRKDKGFTVSEEAIFFDTHTLFKSGEIKSTLFTTTDSFDIPENIATQLIEIFSGEIDFHNDLRKGDRFSIIYEMSYLRGEPVRSGRILAAEFTSRGKTYSAYLHTNESGISEYFDSEGRNMQKAFLRSPVEFTRISSNFSNSRFHPVLKKWRAHKGTDYAAPTGTRVKAASDGIVTFAGYRSGYGNLILVNHHGSYATAYGHLYNFANGVRQGKRVSQGEIIGYVGQTGIATGPHLHYELILNGQQIDPLTAKLPQAAPLEGKYLNSFKADISPLRTHLDLARNSKLTTFQ